MVCVMALPSEFDLLTLREKKILDGAGRIVLQSVRQPCAKQIAEEYKNTVGMDGLFADTADFDELYTAGAKLIMEQKDTVFCAIGNVYENGFVQALEREQVDILGPGADRALEWALWLAGDEAQTDAGAYRVAPAREIEGAFIDSSVALAVTGIDNAYTAAGVKLALSEYYPLGTKAFLYIDGKGEWAELYEIDRMGDWGSGGVLLLTGLPLINKQRYTYYDLVRVMELLRSENGCPWDKEQTHKSLRQYILEEAYETVEAIDEDDMDALYDELGDVLLQVVFHAEIARQAGEFDEMDVTTAVCQKMILRHPHIFGAATAHTPDEVVKNWEAIKKAEKGKETYTDVLLDIPKAMGAMMRAYKIQKKAAAIGFDFADARDAYKKVLEEAHELAAELATGDKDKTEREFGDLLFAVINVLRLLKINPETALSLTCEKFIERFSYMEKTTKKDLAEMTIDEFDELWEAAKEKNA
ncbi:MAG: nucleoside triphosphate pyrophosphohydrolase [Christensenellaceae bacterium]|jgi:tetrapyrrole methylase family protein/MazG family protein